MAFFGSGGAELQLSFLSDINILGDRISKDYRHLMLRNLMKNIFQDIITRLVGVDKRIQNSYYGDKTKIYQYNGLIDILINNYINQTKSCYTVELNKGFIVYKEVKNQKPSIANSFNMDFSRETNVEVLLDLYEIVLNLFKNARFSTKLANSITFKINNLRTQSPQEKKFIEQQLETTANSLARGKGAGYMDANDSIDIMNIDANAYSTMLDMVYSQICHITRLPIAYVSGSASGSLNTTGEGERIQLNRALEGYFNEYLKPILVEISSIIGANQNITMRPDNLANFEAIAPFLTILEQTTILTDKQKQAILQEALGDIVNTSNSK